MEKVKIFKEDEFCGKIKDFVQKYLDCNNEDCCIKFDKKPNLKSWIEKCLNAICPTIPDETYRCYKFIFKLVSILVGIAYCVLAGFRFKEGCILEKTDWSTHIRTIDMM